MVGLAFTLLLVVVIGLLLGDVAILVGIAFVLLPQLTLGLPSVFLLTPIFARIWYILVYPEGECSSSYVVDEK